MRRHTCSEASFVSLINDTASTELFVRANLCLRSHIQTELILVCIIFKNTSELTIYIILRHYLSTCIEYLYCLLVLQVAKVISRRWWTSEGGKTEMLGENPHTVPLCRLLIAYEMDWHWSWASAASSLRVTPKFETRTYRRVPTTQCKI
jgi:hypothetical protein